MLCVCVIAYRLDASLQMNTAYAMYTRVCLFASKDNKGKYAKLTNREIILKEFYPIWSRYHSVTDRQTDGRTICRIARNKVKKAKFLFEIVIFIELDIWTNV